VISSFRRETDEKFALLGYYSASSGKLLPPFRDNLSVEDGTDRLYRNVDEKLPLCSSGVQNGIFLQLRKQKNAIV